MTPAEVAMIGFDYEIENGVEDVTAPADVWRKHKLTGERWIRLHLSASASRDAVVAFECIEDYIREQATFLSMPKAVRR